MIIMGIHGGVSINQHDPGCAIIEKGLLRVFIEEERLNRIKGSRGILPIFSILKCLRDTSLDIRQVDLLAICGDTYLDIEEITKVGWSIILAIVQKYLLLIIKLHI